MKSRLDDKEKEQLADIEKFNSTVGATGWHIKDKKLEEENLAGIKLNNSSLKNTDLLQSKITSGEIRNSVFKGVDATGSDFSDSKFTDVEFSDCIFRYTKFARAEFVRCVFRGCHSENTEMENAVFHECTFERLDDNSGLFTRSEFSDSRFMQCHLDNSSFYYAKLRKVLFDGGHLDHVVMANTVIEEVDVDKGRIDFCSFNESDINRMNFKQAHSKGITFGKAVISGMTLTECDNFTGLNLINSTCTTVVIASSKLFSEPTFYGSKLNDLEIRDCNVAYLDLVEAEITGDSKIADCTISGANMSQAKVVGIVISSTTFDDYLVLDDGIFEGLKLRDVTFNPGLEVDASNVQYINSDRFPSP